MNIIVFSYNRALQLHAFLSSFYKHFKTPDYELNVIYNSGGGDFEKAYLELQLEFPNAIFTRRSKIEKIPSKYFFSYKKNIYRYIKHQNLRKHLTNFKELVEHIVSKSRYDAVAFFTDDSIFYKDIAIDKEVISKVGTDKNFESVFSLRHGLNLLPQPASILQYNEDNYYWDLVPSPVELVHWTHLFSIDGHVYPRQLLLPVFKKLNYVNPNSFEGFVNDYITTEKTNVCTKLIFPEQSVLIGFELNKVQTFANNNNLNFSVESLNNKFMDGYRLRYLYDESSVTDFRPHLAGIEFVNPVTGEAKAVSFGNKYDLSFF
jgi:hypothetical protein